MALRHGIAFSRARISLLVIAVAAAAVPHAGLAQTEPNGPVLAPSGARYDLTLGQPDPQGPHNAALFSQGNAVLTLPGPMNIMGHIVSGTCATGPAAGRCSNGPTFAPPGRDVIDAWNRGWTGQGKTILMIDGYAPVRVTPTNALEHGVQTMLLAGMTAIGAGIYGLDLSVQNALPSGTVKMLNGAPPPNANIRFDVINASFGVNLGKALLHPGPYSEEEVRAVNAHYAGLITGWMRAFNGQSTAGNYRLTDATISKAAGNDGVHVSNEGLAAALAADPQTAPRLILVGALQDAGSAASPATIAAYSNTPGPEARLQSRFLLASAKQIYRTDRDIAVDGVPLSSTDAGTSYAAPRVAGYAAIVRQKFPNLSGSQTADILLQTARLDTLACFRTPQGCDRSIYGQGEASLGRALAPVGHLR